ncbi:transporter [Tritrichomonas foetus]|uniref:Lysosomal dipeptide transporter MFSD1 n=1 Tax=Tritrichomonas foetus TaxID=1144522 RepID=A0A1J4JL19_9EUKA|nr:transporter [Tritrichomonas foetus]|eukprot:OHS99790.1 transporter [Tritrichomonas foetus]
MENHDTDSYSIEESETKYQSGSKDVSASVEEDDTKGKRPVSFHVRRILGFANYAILYALVFFQRTCPSIVSADMAKDYGVPKKDLGVFSSIFFYPYGIVQPFAGLLADVVEPAYVIGICQLIAGVGTIICGLSNSMSVGCIGRFLVGLGCGPTYVPIVRIIANWFPLKYYAHMCGVLLAIGGVGGIIAQGPLSSFAQAVGWRWSFYGIGGLGILFSITELLFVRGDPTTLGYKPVNKDIAAHADADSSCKDKLRQLFSNFKSVVAYPWFWLVVIYSVFCSGPYFDVSGMWGGPFLTDVFNMEATKVGNTLIALSVGLIAGSLFIPPLSSVFRTRKWVLFVTALIACISLTVFAIFGSKLPYGVVILLFLFLGMFTNSMTSVCYPLIREYFHPAIAGTAVGCANIFTFLSTAVFQNISGEVIALTGKTDDPERYSERGYQIGLWMITAISMGISTLVIAFAKDSQFAPKAKKSEAEDDLEKEQVGSDLGEL